jgi:phosphonate transport system substrate-binding protein
MRIIYKGIIGLMLYGLSLATLAGEDIEIAIFPYLSVHQLLGLYEPLRSHLEQESGRPARLITAKDFPSFVQDVHQHSYTLLINAPHMARLAELKAGYEAILRPEAALYPVIVVEADSGISELSELRGAQIATPFASAIITMMGAEILREAGMLPGLDVTFSYAGSHNNAVEQLLNEEAVKAAIVSSAAFGAVSERYQGRVQRLLENRAVSGLPPVVYLAGPHLSAAERQQLQQSLLHFANQSEEGKAMLQASRHYSLRIFDQTDRAAIDPFMADTLEAFHFP